MTPAVLAQVAEFITMPSVFGLSLALGLIAPSIIVEAATCDIYGYGKAPCVAAHSTTRALYDAYNGPPYQVRRAYDNATTDIKYI